MTPPPVSPQPVPSQPIAHQPASHRPAAHRSALRDPFAALPAVDPTTAEPVAEAHDSADYGSADYMPPAAPTPVRPEPTVEPPPSPRFAAPARPESYLPSSVRIIADDRSVAMAPQAAIAPPVPDRPIETVRAIALPAVEVDGLDLPKISYPEITPAEEPVPERAGSGRGRRPLQVAVAVLVLAAGGYLAKSFLSPVQGNAPAAAMRVDRPELVQEVTPAAPAAATTPLTSGPAAATAPLPSRPIAGAPPAPASSGFAAALEPRAMTSGTPPTLPANAGAAAPAASRPDSTLLPAPIAPAPGEMQMDVPALPGDVPLVSSPSARNDSAMKRILRALNGGKDLPPRP